MTYAIADEPSETGLGHWVVDPSGPLLASMVCGAWLAVPWFAVNAIALGSPTKRKEIGLCVLTLIGTVVLGWAVLALREAGIIHSITALRFALLGVVTWKVGMMYAIHTIQSRTFHVYEYYDGPVRSSSAVISFGWMASGLVIGLFDDPLWVIVVSGGA
ncbi:MAG: hypothetical protein AB7O24_11180 [Kofleriaceae bacterium]